MQLNDANNGHRTLNAHPIVAEMFRQLGDFCDQVIWEEHQEELGKVSEIEHSSWNLMDEE